MTSSKGKIEANGYQTIYKQALEWQSNSLKDTAECLNLQMTLETYNNMSVGCSNAAETNIVLYT